jgi:hypothetical protein
MELENPGSGQAEKETLHLEGESHNQPISSIAKLFIDVKCGY